MSLLLGVRTARCEFCSVATQEGASVWALAVSRKELVPCFAKLTLDEAARKGRMIA